MCLPWLLLCSILNLRLTHGSEAGARTLNPQSLTLLAIGLLDGFEGVNDHVVTYP